MPASMYHWNTQRIVAEAFAAGQPELQTLPAHRFDAVLKLERRVSHDGFVAIGGNYYSVPDRTPQGRRGPAGAARARLTRERPDQAPSRGQVTTQHPGRPRNHATSQPDVLVRPKSIDSSKCPVVCRWGRGRTSGRRSVSCSVRISAARLLRVAQYEALNFAAGSLRQIIHKRELTWVSVRR